MKRRLALLAAFVVAALFVTSAQAGEKHKIYTLMPHIALSGIVDPSMPDRKDIDKAWPKKPADAKKIRIGWTEINQVSDWFIGVRISAEAEAKKYGYELSFLIADDDANNQSQHIDTFITQGVDVIVVDPVNASAPVRDIERAVAAGIPVICSSAVPEDSPILTTLTANPFMNGFEAGKYIVSKFGKDQQIVATMIAGVMGSSSTESRLAGVMGGIYYARRAEMGNPYKQVEDAWLDGFNFFEAVKRAGKGEDASINFVLRGYGIGKWSVEGGLAAGEDLCTANPDMNLMIAENDFMAAGAVKALKDAGMMDKVVVAAAADGTVEGMELIKDGDMICTGFNSGYEQGAFVIDFIKAIFEEGKDPGNLPLGSYFSAGIITKDNVDQYYVEGEKFFKSSGFVYPKSITDIKAGK